MEPRLTLVTIGVADVQRSVAFYRDVVGWTPAMVLDDFAFFDLGGTLFAVWPHAAMAAELGVPQEVSAYRAVALAHNVRSREAVDAVFADLRERGATISREPTLTAWGGYSGYFQDPDGHRWEIAHNPGWPLDEHGRVALPST
jgi:catechol 2,3-dioxygenase-like lactoylglutathione lyase family enzyme